MKVESSYVKKESEGYAWSHGRCELIEANVSSIAQGTGTGLTQGEPGASLLHSLFADKGLRA